MMELIIFLCYFAYFFMTFSYFRLYILDISHELISLSASSTNARLNLWLLNGRNFFGMWQKRGLLYGATATHYSSDIPFLLFKYV